MIFFLNSNFSLTLIFISLFSWPWDNEITIFNSQIQSKEIILGFPNGPKHNHKCPLKWKKEAGFSAREVHLKKTKLVFTIERHQKPRKIASFYKVKK